MEAFEIVHALVNQNGGAATRAQLRDGGVTDRQLGRLVREHRIALLDRGVYSLPGWGQYFSDAYRARIIGYLRSHHTSGKRVLTAQSASVLLHLPLWQRVGSIYIGANQSNGSHGAVAKNLGVVPPRQIAAMQIDQLHPSIEFWSATVPRCLCDAARTGDEVNAVCLGDAALRRRLVRKCEIEEVAATLGGMKGAARARRLAGLLDGAAESPGESKSRVEMRRLGVPAPELQSKFFDSDGEIGRVDFFWREYGVIGEYDGAVKYGRDNPSGLPVEQVVFAEKVREDRLRALGYVVVRWTTDDLRHPERLLRKLRDAFKLAGLQGTRTS